MDDLQSETTLNKLSIQVKEGGVFVAGERLLDEEIQRSKLLKDMLSSDGLTSVPLSDRLFKRWREYVRMETTKAPSDAEANFKEGDVLANSSLDDRVAVLEAADVLIDDASVSAATHAIASDLTVRDELLTVLESFTTARQLSVIRAAPVTVVRLLRSLPESYHPLVIESQVDSAGLMLDSELLPASCRPPPGLSTLTFLTSLSLPHTDAAACDPYLFAAALEGLVELVHLNLHDSGVTAACAPALADAMKQLTALKHVDLSSNTILRSGLEALLPPLQSLTSITFLSFSRNSIIAARPCLQRIISMLPLLKSLDISFNSAVFPDVDDERATSVPQPGDSLEEQERLRLHAAHLRAVQFPSAPPLEDLLLANSGLENSDFVSFVAPLLMSVAATLRSLDLSENNLTPLAAPYICDPLQHMRQLKDLNLYSCALTAADVCSMLEAIQQAANEQMINGEQQICAPMLEVLNVAYMDTHLMVGADAVLIGNCTALKNLNISCIEMPQHDMDIIQIRQLTALTALDMSHSVLYVEFLEQLTGLTGLMSLKASAVLEGPMEEPALTALLQSLMQLTSLTELDLSENNLQDNNGVARALHRLTDIQELNLGGNDLLQPKSELPAALSMLKSLRMLVLSENEVAAECARELANSVKQLTGLTALMFDRMCQDKGATLALGSALQRLTGLSALDLSENELPRNAQPLLANMLCRMTDLQELELAENNLTADGIEMIAGAIADLPRLSVLVISDNRLQPSAASSFGEVLKRLEWLRELDLSGNKLGHKGLVILSQFIRDCTSLQAVNLGDVSAKEGKPIQGVGWAGALSALAVLPGLRELTLGANVFTQAIVHDHIAPSISRMTGLQALNIEDCEMSFDAVAEWMDALAPLTGLNGLCIGGNTLPANIGSLLAHFRLLEDVSLRDSGLSDNDLHVLAPELVTLSGLRMLTLSLNDLSEEAVARAAEVLPRVIIEFEQDEEDELVSMDGEETDSHETDEDTDDATDEDEEEDEDSDSRNSNESL